MERHVWRTALALALALTLLTAGACCAAEELTVYTARSESLNNLVIPNFEKDTGIKVNMIVAGTGPLRKRVESEKDNPQGDIFWASDRMSLESIKDLFEPYISPEDVNMMEEFRNRDGYFSPAFADPTVFVVHKGLEEELGLTIDSFDSLLDPKLKGKIACGDPANSNSALQILLAMLYGKGDGDPMAKEAWDFVDKFIANLDGKILTSSGGVHKGAADGEYVVGLTWEEPAATYVRNGAPVSVVFPKEGAIFPGESVQIIKGCKNMENAKKFVDYMLSEKIQNMAGRELTIRPLRKGVELADYMTPMSQIQLAKGHDEAWVAAHKDEIVALWNQHLEDSQ
ncbi:MAG: extracellular solute-binding protein [Synergistaceae bacterium]|nr:extracellular solute-binding protein [Synergistaceae bacterium]